MMKLTIDGISHTFTPIRAFRAAHNLPPEFGVSLFEPKDYAGLGSIDRAGAELNAVRAAVLTAVPAPPAPHLLLPTVSGLTELFRGQLYAINHAVGLQEVEIEFAVAGFADVTQGYAYALVRARLPGGEPADFDKVYQNWFESSARVAGTVHEYRHDGRTWQVQVVSHAYGRGGLLATCDNATYDVMDTALACPAEGYTAALLREVCGRLAG